MELQYGTSMLHLKKWGDMGLLREGQHMSVTVAQIIEI